MSQSRTWRRDWPLEAVLTVLAIVTSIPFVLTIINSFKENPQFFKEFWLTILPLYPENYAISLPRMGRAIFASFSYSIPTLVLTLVISGLAGYAFARYRFPGKQILFFSVLALIMIPGVLLLVPMFSLIVDLKWTDTLQGVVLPWTALDSYHRHLPDAHFFRDAATRIFRGGAPGWRQRVYAARSYCRAAGDSRFQHTRHRESAIHLERFALAAGRCL